jgi:hypothetical protein
MPTNQSPEDDYGANSQKFVCIKYISDRGQYLYNHNIWCGGNATSDSRSLRYDDITVISGVDKCHYLIPEDQVTQV